VTLTARQIESVGLPLQVVEGGVRDGPGMLFLHGWPATSASFAAVMERLAGRARVAAIDLPGIGNSPVPPPANDKKTLAGVVRGAIAALGLRQTTLVGQDVGGMITYAYLHAYPGTVERAVIMNTAIPGVDPWEEVVRNPQIWHFGFHAVPRLPETLVAGRQGPYFDFFYDVLSRPGGVSREARQRYVEAYSRPEALKTGFDWYRAFPRDAEDNRRVDRGCSTAVLYLRGERESGDLDRYVAGLRAGGLREVRGQLIADSGHFAADEAPEAVAALLGTLIGRR
jgi:pimeloyl-ACP methyl ester carboxylesterase